MNELSDMENNLALMVAIEETKIAVMDELAMNFQQATVINSNFKTLAEVWRQAAIDSRESSKGLMEGVKAFDYEGKIKAFLETHELNPLWMEKP